ncbi:MAG: hypothetical protein JW795_09530, partial [Chitinivibrionales bacterium]|nr:hypothetical protein [Chitinivibrionales bacterium]
MKRMAVFIASIVLFFVSCGSDFQSSQSGTLSVSVYIVKNRSEIGSDTDGRRDITLSTLQFKIYSAKGDTLADSIVLKANQQSCSATFSVAAGAAYMVECWTFGSKNLPVHHGMQKTAVISAGESVPLFILCDPVCGSLYIPITNIPKEVDSLCATFNSGKDTVHCSIKCNATSEMMTLDYIPDKATGMLTIQAFDVSKTVIFRASKELTFDAKKNTTISIQFDPKSGKLSLSIAITEHGITIVFVNMNQKDTIGKETGPLIISEIQYFAEGDSDYVELYNPTPSAQFFDTLVIEV